MALTNAYLQLMAKWAARIGSPFVQYRPTDPLSPYDSDGAVATLNAIFDASQSLAFNAPSMYNHPTFGAILDPQAVQAGDYLVSDAQGTWFIGSTEPLKPILGVQCNSTLNVVRPGTRTPSRSGYYGGEMQDTPIITGYPGSLLNGTKGEASVVGLPGDTRQQWSAILLPPIPDAIIHQYDRVIDDLGRGWIVSAVERTNLGWRLTASYAAA